MRDCSHRSPLPTYARIPPPPSVLALLPNSESTDSADLNLRLLRHLVRYLVDHYTPAEVEGVARAGSISVAVMLAGTGWVSIAQFEALLAQARELIADEA